jgi:hypothetical protein
MCIKQLSGWELAQKTQVRSVCHHIALPFQCCVQQTAILFNMCGHTSVKPFESAKRLTPKTDIISECIKSQNNTVGVICHSPIGTDWGIHSILRTCLGLPSSPAPGLAPAHRSASSVGRSSVLKAAVLASADAAWADAVLSRLQPQGQCHLCQWSARPYESLLLFDNVVGRRLLGLCHR